MNLRSVKAEAKKCILRDNPGASISWTFQKSGKHPKGAPRAGSRYAHAFAKVEKPGFRSQYVWAKWSPEDGFWMKW